MQTQEISRVVNQANLGFDSVVFRQNRMDANLRDDIFLYSVLEKWRWRQVDGKEKKRGRCSLDFCKREGLYIAARG
jgi:hypothetical protein